MNLPRRSLADIAGGRPVFSRVVETGSQPGNLDRIARSEADATAVDNVTYVFWSHCRPSAAVMKGLVIALRWQPSQKHCAEPADENVD